MLDVSQVLSRLSDVPRFVLGGQLLDPVANLATVRRVHVDPPAPALREPVVVGGVDQGRRNVRLAHIGAGVEVDGPERQYGCRDDVWRRVPLHRVRGHQAREFVRPCPRGRGHSARVLLGFDVASQLVGGEFGDLLPARCFVVV